MLRSVVLRAARQYAIVHGMIAQALSATAAEEGLSATQIAARIGRSEASARQYMAGRALPSGDILILLMTQFPSFAKRLGFEAVSDLSVTADAS